MTPEFVKPKFTGPRFAGHTLPVDVARDLAAYEALLIELAKHLYLQEHPDRQRVPKGFSDVHLDIAGVGEGSAIPVLVLVVANALTLPGIDEHPYFSQARNLIAECIAAPESALPVAFPKELLSHFNQLGRSLRDGEALELERGEAAAPAVLNSDKRKKLVLAASQVYEREIELTGAIMEVDWEKSSFRLRLVDGSQAIIPMPESFHEKARQSGGRGRDYVCVKGVATYDSWEHMQRVIAVESLEVIKNYPLVAQFDGLAQLTEGWHDGQGKVPDRARLEVFSQNLIAFYPERLPLPSIVPTQEGNLLLEWETVGSPSVDVDLHTMLASFHAFGKGHEDVEMDFPLNHANDWPAFLAFLAEHVRMK
jgi:hypothetical protein